MRILRKGKLQQTPNGPMYQHHDVWITPYSQNYIKEIAEDWGIDENHVIGKIVDEWVAKDSVLRDRLSFLVKTELPNVIEKHSKR